MTCWTVLLLLSSAAPSLAGPAPFAAKGAPTKHPDVAPKPTRRLSSARGLEKAEPSPSPSPMGYQPPPNSNAKWVQDELGKPAIIEVTKNMRAGQRVAVDCLSPDLPVATVVCDGSAGEGGDGTELADDKGIRLTRVAQDNPVLMGAVWAPQKKGDKLAICIDRMPGSFSDAEAPEGQEAKTGDEGVEVLTEEVVYCCKDKMSFSFHKAACAGGGESAL